MSETAILEEIRNDLNFLKEKVTLIEASLNEIDTDMHKKINPEYAKKLEKIEKEDKRIHFKNIEEFDKRFSI